VDVLYDDRDAGPGEKLTDAELIGLPLRVVVGRRALADGEVETQVRRSGEDRRIGAEGAAAEAAEMLAGLE
jgi:prolyl-tRNA synthetase